MSMTTSTKSVADTAPAHIPPDTPHLHEAFLALMPKLTTHATIAFQHIRCPDTRADKVNESVALAWKWLTRLHERGKDVNDFVMAFVFLVVRAVKCGRRVAGQEKARDVLSARAQRRHGFSVASLPASTRAAHDDLYSQPHGQEAQDTFEERLRDNSQTPVPDQVAFRADWPRFLGTLTARDRAMAEFLGMGHAATAAAAKFNLSPGRVTQLRQRWCDEWRRFEDPEAVSC